MKSRAAVAFEAKQPLEIVDLDLEGPKAGEVLVEIAVTHAEPGDGDNAEERRTDGRAPDVPLLEENSEQCTADCAADIGVSQRAGSDRRRVAGRVIGDDLHREL